MARRSSFKSLKDEKPHWFCIPNRYGTVAELASSGIKLHYITDPRGVADIWRYIGNPKFRSEYAYLLVSFGASGVIDSVYAVRPTEEVNEDVPKRFSNLDAFEGDVDKICFGWTSGAHAKLLAEGVIGCTGSIPPRESGSL